MLIHLFYDGFVKKIAEKRSVLGFRWEVCGVMAKRWRGGEGAGKVDVSRGTLRR